MKELIKPRDWKPGETIRVEYNNPDSYIKSMEFVVTNDERTFVLDDKSRTYVIDRPPIVPVVPAMGVVAFKDESRKERSQLGFFSSINGSVFDDYGRWICYTDAVKAFTLIVAVPHVEYNRMAEVIKTRAGGAVSTAWTLLDDAVQDIVENT